MLTRITGGDAERAKMLLLAGYFAESMKDEERRKILFEVCGDVDDSAVLDEVPDLREYLLIPGGDGSTYSPEERKKIAVKERQGYNKKLTELPARIDELSRSLPETAGPSVTEIAETIKAKQADLAMLKAGRKADDRRAAVRAALAGIDAEEKTRRKAYMDARMEETKQAAAEATALQVKLRNAENNAMRLESDAAQLAARIEATTKAREALLAEFCSIRDEAWNEGEECCPTCKRRYDPEKIDELRSVWADRKAERLAALNMKGQSCSTKVIADLQVDAANITTMLEEARAEAKAARENYEQQAKAYSSPVEIEAEFFQSQAAAALREKRRELEEKLANIQDDDTTEEEQLAAEIEKLIYDKSRAMQATETARRIGELEQEKLDAAAGLEQAERVIFLCEEFTRAKVRMVTDRINAKFTGVRWLLFREQINGGLKECCEPLIPNAQGTAVECRSANTAAQVNAGLEIIQVLAQHYGTQLPVIVDRAESVCELRKIDGQIIRLIVSAEDKALKIINR